MKLDKNNNIYNKNDYLLNFNTQLSLKKFSNQSSLDKLNMSYKHSIPISNYDYSSFNFLLKIQKEIFIKDLFQSKNNTKRFYYKYITGKIISELYWDDFIYFLISDKNDDIIAVSVYHLEDKFYPLNIDYLQKNYLKKEKYILIINPLFTFEHYNEIMCFDNCEFILFDNYENIKDFTNMNNDIKEVNDLIKLGDLMMGKTLYDKAIYYYDKGIKMSEKNNWSEIGNIIYKISLAYFNYGYFSKVFFYYNYFDKNINMKNSHIDDNSINIKDLKFNLFYIKLQSYIKLRKYADGYQFYLKSKENEDIHNSIKLNINNINQLIEEIILKKENEKGIYDYKKMLLEEKNIFYLNYGDYISNKVSIEYDSKKGLKLVCNKNNSIKKGELVISEKALVCKKTNSERNESTSINLEMTNELMEKIKKYKEDNKIFFILYNNKNKEMNLEERKNSYFKGIEKTMDFTEYKNIIDYNKYSCSRNIFYDNNKGVGLWGYTSLMNHSCNPNINNFTIGDFMFCFASKDILPGTELTSLYFSNSYHYSLRQEKSKKNWNFICDCEFCFYEKNIINNNNKIYYENSIKDFFDMNDDIVKHSEYRDKFIEFEKFLNNAHNELSDYEIGNGYLKLIYHYGVLNDYKKSKELSEKMFLKIEKKDYYSLLLENLNYLFYFFGYKDKNIINYLIPKYRNLILNYSCLKNEDFETLVNLTLIID